MYHSNIFFLSSISSTISGFTSNFLYPILIFTSSGLALMFFSQCVLSPLLANMCITPSILWYSKGVILLFPVFLPFVNNSKNIKLNPNSGNIPILYSGITRYLFIAFHLFKLLSLASLSAIKKLYSADPGLG